MEAFISGDIKTVTDGETESMEDFLNHAIYHGYVADQGGEERSSGAKTLTISHGSSDEWQANIRRRATAAAVNTTAISMGFA